MRAERQAELGLEHLDDARAHEIDDRLRRVDDAVRVGRLDRVPLEEPLVDGVEEVLLVGEVVDRLGGGLDRLVKLVERLEEVGAAEALAHQRGDDRLDFGRDDVALGELVVVENLAEQPFREQVLHQHLIDGFAADVRVERVLAEGEEGAERGLELGVGLVPLGDADLQPLGEFGHALAELAHGVLEALDVRLGERVELVQQVGHGVRVRQVVAGVFGAVLKQHRLRGVLEDGVDERVTLQSFLANLVVEVVVRVLGLPVAARQVVAVLERAVGADRLAAGLHRLLGDERPPVRLGGDGQQVRERRLGGPFVRGPVLDERLERGVVRLDRRVGVFDGRGRTHS